jgi:hypothetical protein
MKIRHRISILLPIAAMLFCGREYNPFTDYSNAGVQITHQSLKNRDTISIFHTETLTTVVLVKELVDHFVVRSDDNRLWPSPDSIINHSAFGADPVTFLFSFFDTGGHVIRVTAFKTNGQKDSTAISFYVRSPLFQNNLTGGYGDSFRLRTPPVPDKDVMYFWSFGAGAGFSSLTCSTTVALFTVLLSGKGGLWVSDGLHASCADSFGFSIRDTTKPDILCVNENYVGKDTVYTGDSVFNFKARISDRGDRWVDSASINGKPFDRNIDKTYYSLIDKMYTHDSLNPLLARVYALDHFQNGNSREKTITIIFSPVVGPATPASIVVLSPTRDSAITMMRRFIISGNVENHSFDSLHLALLAYVNDSLDPATRIITDKSPSWDWTIDLVPGINRITLAAKEYSTLSAVDRVSFTIVYLDTAHDSAAPIISAITANGNPANNYYTDKASALIGVKAYDEISGVDSLFINGRPCTASVSGWYYDSIGLAHTPSGNEVIVRAKDRKANQAVAEALIYRNRLPVVQRKPASLFIAMDSAYSDTVQAFDPDGDTVAYQITSGPPGLSVSNEGVLSWKPGQRDTGNHAVTMRLFDGYQPQFCVFTLYVFGDIGHPGPVRFATKTEDFPTYLEAGKDTMRLTLRVADKTGIGPFLFSGRIANKAKSILAEGHDSLLIWMPQPADTGFEQLMVIVKDAFPSSDTLYPRILVVPHNRPCSLSVSFSATTTPTGALDLNKKRDKDTLIFHIKDPDNPLVERHDVSIYESRTQLRSIIDSAVVDSFSLALDPLAFDGYDTIVAVVRDRSGATDTLKQTIYYGMPPYIPQAQNPLNLMTINATSVTLSWQDVDPDGDGLTFDVYFGGGPDQLSRLATTVGTSFMVTGLSAQRTYYWKIIAHDWKSFTEGPAWQFTTR